MLLQDTSYELVGVQVHVLEVLNIGTECEIVSIDDIGDVIDDNTTNEEFGVVNYVVEGDIDGV